MDAILREIKRNEVDYPQLRSVVDVYMPHDNDCDISVVVGARGRKRFLQPLIDSFERAIDSLSGHTATLTIVEHSSVREHKELCRDESVNYIWIPCASHMQFSRSLVCNVGVLFGPKSKWVLTHDLDCMVQSSFLGNLLKNAENHNTQAVQSFNKRRVLYCNEELSDMVISGYVDVNKLGEQSKGIFTCKGEAPGGSIFLSRDLFFTIGGYDPELFYGYAPEDAMLWEKMSQFCKVASADNPVTDIFHLHHEFMGGTNPHLKDMIGIYKHFMSLPRDRKMDIIEYKSKQIEPWR